MASRDKKDLRLELVQAYEKLGQEGIIPRLNKVEAYQQSDKIYKAKVAGGLLIGVPLIDGFLHWLGKHF